MKNATFYDLSSINLDQIGLEKNHFSWPNSIDIYRDLGKKINNMFYKNLTENDFGEDLKLALSFCFSDIIIYAERVTKIIFDIESNNQKDTKFILNPSSSPLFNLLNNEGNLVDEKILLDLINCKPTKKTIDEIILKNLKQFISIIQMVIFSSNKGYDLHNQNVMMYEYLNKNKLKFKLLRPNLWRWNFSKKETFSIESLIETFLIILERYLKTFCLDNNLIQNGLSYFKLASVFQLKSTLEKYLFLKNSKLKFLISGNLIGGTPKTIGKILNHFYQKNNKDVYRFSHGGDRFFFQDINWKMSELIYTKKYFCHSSLEAKIQSQKYNYEISKCPFIKNLSFCSQGSEIHKKIWISNNFKRLVNKKKKVLLVSGSFLGEKLMGYSQFKLPDLLSLDLIIFTYNILSKNNFDVSIKPHPKGMYKDFFNKNRKFKLFTGNILDKETNFDCFIFEFAGSAFYDVLLSNKGIMLLDTNVRPWYKPAKSHLSKRCEIVKTYTDQNNWLRFNINDFTNKVSGLSETIRCEEKFAQSLYN